MKHRLLLFFIIFSAAVFSGCLDRKEEIHNNNRYPVKIIPAGQTVFSNENVNMRSSSIERDADVVPKITLNSNYNILYIKNINLDYDIEDEQVIVVNLKDDKSLIKLFVVDFDSVRNKYVTTWETEKIDINPRSVSVSYLDVVGDHNLELIFTASSAADNNQIFDIFRKTHSPTGIRLYYESICELVLDGQVEIIEKERSLAYTLGQKNGISFPIVSNTTLPTDDTDQPPDILKTSYVWSYQHNRYLKGFEEVIPGKKLEEEKLRRLFFEGIDAYKTFLQGQWYNIESPGHIIRFDKEINDITMFTKDSLETYQWLDFSFSRFWNRIDINARNNLIHFISKRIIIQVESMNRIIVEIRDIENIKDIDPMNGIYERISEELIDHIFYTAVNKNIKPDLKGEYSGNNEILIFDGKNITKKSNTGIKKGLFSVYEYNSDLILELRFTNQNTIVNEVKLYKLDYEHKEVESAEINRITLLSGFLTPFSFRTKGEDPVIYMQTIEKDVN